MKVPLAGELIIGRDPECALMLTDPLVSRRHAQLLLVPEGLRFTDLSSRHGTLVNGERLVGSRLLRSGDILALGATVIVVRRAARSACAQQVAEVGALLRRIGEETDRALRYQRELAVIALRMTGPADVPRLSAGLVAKLRSIDVIAASGENSAIVLMPELGLDEASLALDDALAGLEAADELAIGLAIAPFDGIDGDTLLGAARAAAEVARAGQRRAAADAVTELAAVHHKITVADPAMTRIYELARRLARSPLPVLVLGETGVGKELAAAAVHALSAHAAGPFVSVNCAAIPESLAESELFGHARGAFSGALSARAGHLEAAHEGTLFLDEIGELPPSIQAKLLRALESGEVLRVGETTPRLVDLRVVAATNRDLEEEVAAGRFRADLYFRLGAARLVLPPLRDRPRDLAALSARFLDEACRGAERAPLAWSVAAAQTLFLYAWPGNLRELRNAVHYAVSAAPEDATEIEPWHLPPALLGQPHREEAPAAQAAATPDAEPSARFRPIGDEVRELERQRMVESLRATGGVQNRAAELIEMPLRTFATKLKRYRIDAEEWGG
ncbi:MAG: sigma 54-interacting transcriptional regulator [Kofleriaceae bacterium]